jgi:uncharacterized protein
VTAFAQNVLLFGRTLRAAGVDVHHSRLLDALQALEWVGVTSRQDVRATLAALLVHREDDVARFHHAFERFFRSAPPMEPPAARRGHSSPASAPSTPHGAMVAAPLEEVDGSTDAPRRVGAYSYSSRLRTTDFADLTPTELQEARRLLARLSWEFGLRRTRRWRRPRGPVLDLRGTLRLSVTRGELLTPKYRRRASAPRPLVILADVSGSMERYSRVLLHFIAGVSLTARHVESFVFATTLTRLGRRAGVQPTRRPLSRDISAVKDWGGGTRIGDSLHAFNRYWAGRVMRHGPVVLLVSDGWDRGDPDLLAREMARLSRSCRRLIWLNPLLGSPDYAPLTRGMQAALPFVDDFLPVHNIDSLERLARRLRELQ